MLCHFALACTATSTSSTHTVRVQHKRLMHCELCLDCILFGHSAGHLMIHRGRQSSSFRQSPSSCNRSFHSQPGSPSLSALSRLVLSPSLTPSVSSHPAKHQLGMRFMQRLCHPARPVLCAAVDLYLASQALPLFFAGCEHFVGGDCVTAVQQVACSRVTVLSSMPMYSKH